MKDDISHIVNTAIDVAVKDQKYILDMYSYLKLECFKRNEMIKFLSSPLVASIRDEIEQLDLYLHGGSEVADLREVYGWMGKPRARKFKDYLVKIIDDATRYEQEKRPGRKPGSKNKRPKVTNK